MEHDAAAFPPLLDAADLRARLGTPGLVVLDAGAAMPGETFDAGAHFRERRIPGARRFDHELFSDPETPLPHMAPSAGRFARLAGALGICEESTVVLYERGAAFAAPRARWLFRLHGHPRVAVLDGGLAAWIAAGGALESGEPAPPLPRHFTPRLRARLLAGLGDVEANATRGGALLLDARAAPRFDGTGAEPRPGIRAGHIPGSRNLPFGRLLAADGRMKPADALRAEFAAVGVDCGVPTIVSCGTGVTAAVLALGLELAGFGEPALYDGSWTEWATVHPAPDMRDGA